MKQFGIILFLIPPLISFSQKVFEGKITYAYHLMKDDSILMITYFSPGKVRTEMYYHNNNVSKDDTYVIGLLDSNIYYVLHPTEKKANKILVDTSGLFDIEKISSVPLNDELYVMGIKCYGIKETMKYDLPLFDSNASTTMQVISHYAKDLYFPYNITPYFTHSSISYNNNICLSTKTSFDNSMFGGAEMVLTAIKVEYNKNPDSLFQIPQGFSIQSTKMSYLLKDSVETKVTVKEITLEELEKPEPPPPPPPKPIKPQKSPPKKKKDRNQ